MEMPKEYRCSYVFLTDTNITIECNKMLKDGFVFYKTVSVNERGFAYLLFAKY